MGIKLASAAVENPFLKTEPDAVGVGRCGVCHGTGMVKHFECRSLDSGFAPLYVCRDCLCLYNATAEFNALDVVEWQKRWAEDPEFYKVPGDDEFHDKVAVSRGVFDFFEAELGVSFAGTYAEIGAGSGIMAAAALHYFASAHVLDHVTTRLEQVRARVGERYHVMRFEDLVVLQPDLVLIWHAMEHFLDPGGVFALCARRLRPGGHFLIQVPVLSEEHVYPGHYYFYSETTFQKLAERHGLAKPAFYYDHAMNAMTVAIRKLGV